jgi:hypothetical protein
MYQRCQLSAELSGHTGEKNWLLRKKVLILTLISCLTVVSILSNYIKKCHLTKGTKFFFAAAEFRGHSGLIFLQRVGNSSSRANKCQPISYKPILQGSRQIIWYL